jgi:uncharacterized XkdX family phage protein
MWFNTVKRFYDAKHPLYTDDNLKGFVQTQMITASDYEVITGKVYSV